MKKILLALLIITIAIMPLCSFIASADEATYYVVGEQDVKLFISNGFSPDMKFSIPKGYAFSVITHNDLGSNYAKINYAGIEGHVLESELATCTATTVPSKLSPDLVLELSTPKTVYNSPHDNAIPSTFVGTAIFLGEYKVDGVVTCYALRNEGENTIYYAYPTNIKNIDAINNLLNPPVIKPSEGETNGGNQGSDIDRETPKNKTVLRIILVLGIVIPAFIIIMIIFKSGKKTQKIEREVPDDSDRFDDY